MTVKKIMLVVMCVMLLLTAAMTGVVAAKVAPILAAFTQTPDTKPNPSVESSSAPDNTETEETTMVTIPESQPTEPEHEHSYEKLSRTEKVTCTTIGYKVYACECGATEIRDVQKATGHDWDDGVKKEATCTEKGGMLYTCNNCNEEELRNTVKATGHSFGQWEPDPEDPYKEIRSCKNCDETEQREAEDPQIPTEEPTEEPTEDPTEDTTDDEVDDDEDTGSGSEVGSGEV